MHWGVKALAIVAIALQAGACATIIEGSSQTVSVSTIDRNGGAEVAGAECTLSSATIGTHRVITPGAARLEKSKNAATVSCTKEGYEAGTATIASHFAAATAGNLLIGGLIGVGIDAASGAANKYDDKVVVTIAKKPEPPPAPGKRMVRREAAPPAPKPMPTAVQSAPPKPAKPPKCKDVGGYEAYKAKTGEICEI